MIEAMEEKGSFCGWAFFHGVMEGLFGEGAGHSKISVEEVHKICRETNFEIVGLGRGEDPPTGGDE